MTPWHGTCMVRGMTAALALELIALNDEIIRGLAGHNARQLADTPEAIERRRTRDAGIAHFQAENARLRLVAEGGQ